MRPVPCLAHYDIGHYCADFLDKERAIICRYNEHADWHVRFLKVPVCEVNFAELTGDAGGIIARMATLVECRDAKAIRKCMRLVGRRRFDMLPVTVTGMPIGRGLATT